MEKTKNFLNNQNYVNSEKKKHYIINLENKVFYKKYKFYLFFINFLILTISWSILYINNIWFILLVIFFTIWIISLFNLFIIKNTNLYTNKFTEKYLKNNNVLIIQPEKKRIIYDSIPMIYEIISN